MPDDAELTFVPLEAVWPRRVDVSRMRTKAETATGYTRFQQGDVLIPKITPTFEADRSTWIERIPSIAASGTTELHVVRARQGVEPRYLDYLFSSTPFLRGGEAEMIGVAGQKRVPDSWLRDFPVPIPGLAEQRAIADYLDAETVRIDALIDKKQQLIHLLEERRETAFDEVLSHVGVDLPIDLDPGAMRSLSLPDGWRVAKLSSALRQLTNGYVGPTRDILVDEGIRYIQGLHVKKGTIDFERRPFFVTQSWHRARPRTSLRPGDVVIVQTGDIGQCAVIPEDFGEANCHALLIARTNESVASGAYLATYLQSVFGRHSLLRLATGALHPHLEFGIRDTPLLLPPKAEQSELIAAVQRRQDRLDVTCRVAIRQLGLLAEHRRALITAAVTGDLQVPGAA